jgi:hypothetical protein
VIRALFPRFDNAADYLKALKAMQLGSVTPVEEDERRITMLMVAGGHFAGMVVGLRPKGKTERQEVKGAGDVRILQHKTFHRYTSEPNNLSRLILQLTPSAKEARRFASFK